MHINLLLTLVLAQASIIWAASLTAYLTGSNFSAEIIAATQNPFLDRAALGSLPVDELSAWMAQDRLYGFSYIHFMGAMLDKLQIPTTVSINSSTQGQYAEVLTGAIPNVRREILLFEDTAIKEGWQDILSVKPSIPTVAYANLFDGAGSPHRSMLVSAVTLFATEWCYYTAWSRAATMVPKGKPQTIMQSTFIPNWSNAEYKEFVDELGGYVEWFARGCTPGSQDWIEAEIAWRQVLWAEAEFWPDSSMNSGACNNVTFRA
ncbi:hypothetical protein AMS68_006726 [Peltaster fructicola]|uniref:Thiaminase-2/PQQC domain-containing protein n=1 Tax=Peltaster fructicola TaxID=286661 RepID=A0A6H0Y2X8_9PEZI|nr:hypothetical protein AMS68_006726 [Peltaster fructicola]